MTEITIRDIVGDKEGYIKLDYSKIKARIKKCEEDKLNQTCLKELKELGIDWSD